MTTPKDNHTKLEPCVLFIAGLAELDQSGLAKVGLELIRQAVIAEPGIFKGYIRETGTTVELSAELTGLFEGKL